MAPTLRSFRMVENTTKLERNNDPGSLHVFRMCYSVPFTEFSLIAEYKCRAMGCREPQVDETTTQADRRAPVCSRRQTVFELAAVHLDWARLLLHRLRCALRLPSFCCDEIQKRVRTSIAAAETGTQHTHRHRQTFGADRGESENRLDTHEQSSPAAILGSSANPRRHQKQTPRSHERIRLNRNARSDDRGKADQVWD